MDERQLNCFLAIAETGSVTGAADRLGMAQPSLSQILLRLEEELKTRLFVRQSRGVTLTEAGQLFKGHARAILDASRQAREDLHANDLYAHPDVAVGLPSSFSTLLTTQLVLAARQNLPGIRMTVSEAMSGHIRRWLEDQQIHLGVLYSIQDIGRLVARQIATEDLFLVAAAGRFSTRAKSMCDLPLTELGTGPDLPLVLPSSGHGLRQFVETAAGQAGLHLNVEIEMDSLPSIKSLVATGDFVTLLPHAAIAQELAEGRLSAARIAKPQFTRGIFLVRNPDQVATRASGKVESLIFAQARHLIETGQWLARLPAGT